VARNAAVHGAISGPVPRSGRASVLIAALRWDASDVRR
jgi:hypothetical protein